ncbi:MAG: hypothetical protein JWQ75_2020 [Pseudarthrobacter sp.]|nr:hypothetical protein [Pseudarthrobacter sp.]
MGKNSNILQGATAYSPSAPPAGPARRAGREILHVGPDPETQGGMASVIAEYMTFSDESTTYSSYSTWAPNSRVLSMLRAAALGLRIVGGKYPGTTFHIHLSEFGSFIREGAIVVLANWRGHRVFVSLHGADFEKSLAKYPTLTKAVLSRASGIVCLGPKQKSVVEAFFPGVPTHVVSNPSGPPRAGTTEETVSPATARRFVFAGDVGMRKGFDIIEKVWPQLVAQYPGLQLQVCGPLIDLPAPRHLPHCEYLGTVSRERVASLLVGAEALLLPSRAEVLPMSALEALRLGTRVVASHAGELDSLAGSTAVTYCDVEVESLKSAIVDVLESSPAEKAAAGEAAVSWSAANTSNDRVARLLQDMYSGQSRSIETSQK